MLHNAQAADVANEVTDPAALLDAVLEADRLNQATAEWHRLETAIAPDDLILRMHRANYDLWHLEDGARDPRASDATIADIKRNIDRVNQRRNDLVEAIDASLLEKLAPFHLPRETSPLHSETPGMMLDRLSILSLKVFHTREQIERSEAGEAHKLRNQQRLGVLLQQHSALQSCLANLWREVTAGTRHFRLYRQMKMYNDPELNPALYAEAGRRGRSGA